jgi:hypothetical protein
VARNGDGIYTLQKIVLGYRCSESRAKKGFWIMSLYKRGSTYHYDFILDGVRRQGSTKLKNRRAAERLVDNLRAKFVNEARGFVFDPPKPQPQRVIPTFRQQSEVWLNHLRTRNRRPIPEAVCRHCRER